MAKTINVPEGDMQLLAAVAAAEDKKAEDIRILALDPSESGLCDYFLICSGTNERQNVAITDEIEIRLKHEFGVYPASVEGRRQGEWVLMDYVDFIVHVFSPEKRAFYGLERLRKTATSLSVAELDTRVKEKIAAARAKSAKKVIAVAAGAAPDVPAEAGKKKAAKTAPQQTKASSAKPASTAKKVSASKAAAKKIAVKKVAAKSPVKGASRKATAKKIAAKKVAVKKVAVKTPGKRT
jgi:ribosome-associated protein